jgi:hypothetical protein
VGFVAIAVQSSADEAGLLVHEAGDRPPVLLDLEGVRPAASMAGTPTSVDTDPTTMPAT